MLDYDYNELKLQKKNQKYQIFTLQLRIFYLDVKLINYFFLI